MYSCSASHTYKKVVKSGKVSDYEDFIVKYPNSKNRSDIIKRLTRAYDEIDWNEAYSAHTITSYQKYLAKHGNGAFTDSARKVIGELELQNAIINAWKEVQHLNSVEAYSNFLNSYPNSKYGFEARQKLSLLQERSVWNEAQISNRIQEYEAYLMKYPNGNYVKEAKDYLAFLKEQETIEPIWEETVHTNTFEVYKVFSEKYSTSSYAAFAKEKMAEIEAADWEKATETNEVDGYTQYLTKYPAGKYAKIAELNRHRLENEKEIFPIWQKVQKINSYQAYYDFCNKHNTTAYVDIAIERMIALDEAAWRRARASNSIMSYYKYLKDIPKGDYVNDAEKKIIDLEVDRIYSGEHGSLPPLEKVYGSAAKNRTHSKVEIQNDTPYELTIWYSGLESRKVQIPAKQITSVKLKLGKYRIAASVKAHNVSNYVGNEDLDGSDYSVKYYIETR